MQFGILPTQQQMKGNQQNQQKGKLYHDFYKTKMCPDFTTLGTCAKGANCAFAHDANELRDKPNLQKTKLCENFLKGFCNNPNCGFAHGEDELRSTNDLYKTALCYNYNQGKCQNGDRCRYAHGYEELRPTPYYLTKKKQQGNEVSIFDLPGIQQQAQPQFNFMMGGQGMNQFMPPMPPYYPPPQQNINPYDFIKSQQLQFPPPPPALPFQNLESLTDQNPLLMQDKMNLFKPNFN